MAHCELSCSSNSLSHLDYFRINHLHVVHCSGEDDLAYLFWWQAPFLLVKELLQSLLILKIQQYFSSNSRQIYQIAADNIQCKSVTDGGPKAMTVNTSPNLLSTFSTSKCAN